MLMMKRKVIKKLIIWNFDVSEGNCFSVYAYRSIPNKKRKYCYTCCGIETFYLADQSARFFQET